MNWLDYVGLFAAAACVGAYAVSVKGFAWANVLLWPLVALPAALRGAWGSVLLAVAFGLTGAYKLWVNRGWRGRVREIRAGVKPTKRHNRILWDMADHERLYYRSGS